MKSLAAVVAAGLALAVSGTAANAQISDDVVKIGVLTDMSSLYADATGKGSLAAVEMAVADYGGKVKGKPVEVVSADHQNKPDVGVNIARQWFDVDKVDVIVDVPNSGVALAVSNLTKEKNGILLNSGAGTSDLTKDLHAAYTRDRLPLLTALQLALLAARASRLAALDGVHLDLSDDEGFALACRQGRELGFDGKTLIHPKQIEAANTAFAPSAEEVAWSRRIIAAYAEAERSGKGVVLVDGKLIENLHIENARRVVTVAEAIAQVAAPR